MLHPIQSKLLELSQRENLAELSLRQMAEAIGQPKESPQKIKHHLLQLQKKGFLTIDRSRGTMERAGSSSRLTTGLLKARKTASRLFTLPVIGTASCGPETIFAEENFDGFLRVSSKLLGQSRPNGLYAIKASGTSMNRANVNGKSIEDGDYIVVDSKRTNAVTNDVVLAIVDDKAVVKRLIDDTANGQVVLKSDSSFDYDPIYLHPDDKFVISGKVVAVIKN